VTGVTDTTLTFVVPTESVTGSVVASSAKGADGGKTGRHLTRSSRSIRPRAPGPRSAPSTKRLAYRQIWGPRTVPTTATPSSTLPTSGPSEGPTTPAPMLSIARAGTPQQGTTAMCSASASIRS
jgi:hypothetical protein